ncbi:MAG: VTT domain-containing protein [Pseudomonadota bacterium]|nr:VTT domain-containing protein [Pseudomonadota bacterium]
MSTPTRILKPGRNCWRIRRAERVAFLVDGADYFHVLHTVLPLARLQILISSWDIYSDIRLGAPQGDKRTLAEVLDKQLHKHRHLHVYMLNWDFSRLLDMGREWLPIYKFGWKTHARLKFKLDSHHPLGASHHQKFVVLDERLAFSGGLDITRGRWDTLEHHPHDVRRKQVDGTLGRPYHDVQIALEGDAASTLADLFRERWRRATDQEFNPLDEPATSLWPPNLEPDMQQVEVAISRTEPAYDDYREVREVEQLYLDAIAAARDFIYIENQFYTCPQINQALIQRLLEENGPQIILNLPLETEGWLSQNSLDIIRVRLLQDLRQADRHGRLAIYYPWKKDLETIPINLHAKVMVVDDRFVRIGSSNLNNRSMGFDTECDIAIEVKRDNVKVGQAIRHFRQRLVSEHLGTSVDKVANAEQQQSDMINSIESLREQCNERCLMPLEAVLPKYEDNILTDIDLIDPEQPINPESLLYHYLPAKKPLFPGKRILAWLTAILLLSTLAAAWNFTPLGQWLEVERVTHMIETLRNYPLAVPVTIAGFAIAAMLMVPVTMLIIACIIVFGAGWGAIYALTGAFVSAVLTYLLGNLMGRDALKGLAGGRVNRISQRLARHGVMTIIFVRIVPVAPFTVINLVAGASHISLRDFMLGTLLGMTPGITAIALLTDRIQATINNPEPSTVLLLLLVVVGMLGLGYLLTRLMRRHNTEH